MEPFLDKRYTPSVWQTLVAGQSLDSATFIDTFTHPVLRFPSLREGVMREKAEAVQVKCPICDHTEIVYIPIEQIPRCPIHRIEMIIVELLDEGKSY